jgi:uroporphyrinogen-III decarboxylase
MVTRRERLMATLRGEPVDRPAVSFYEIGGWKLEPDPTDEFAVWNDPSWRPLVQLAEEKTDLIRMMGVTWKGGSDNGFGEQVETKIWREGPSEFTRKTITVAGRTLTSLRRRDVDTYTVWTLEHFLKNTGDVRAYLELPEWTVGEPNVSAIVTEEEALGDAGIVMIGTHDPICASAELFSMEDYTICALTEGALFHKLLERNARAVFERCEKLSRALPGRLWRVVGSEYASEPYLPPRLYEEYVVRYTGEIVHTIQKHGGFARIHSHGRLRNILPLIDTMRPDGLDPIEPPPQGDMELREVREAIGKDTVLFGNLEASDIENLPADQFEEKVKRALDEGTGGEGRGFVLMPSACPYGRTITTRTVTNYETMVRLVEGG